MPNKLQELTEKLYNEGLSKGKEEGEALLSDARKKAAEMTEIAEKQAAAIIADAEKQAADLKVKAESDIRMASSQVLQATKKDIEEIVVGKICSDKVAAALAEPEFIKEIIRTVATKFDAQESADMSLLLSVSTQDKLEPWVKGELAKALDHKIDASFSKKISGGFTIGPKDGGWFIDLTEDSFKELIAQYIRPVTKKILFG